MKSYAWFRLPREEQFTQVEQCEGAPEVVGSLAELNGKQGFVFAPFEPSAACPILLFHPDRVATGPVEPACGASDAALQPLSGEKQRQQYAHDFSLFHAELVAGRFSKIVLSRSMEVALDQPLQLRESFMSACQLYPRAFVALVSSPRCGTWLMATPEILLSGDGGHYATMALAGTMRLTRESQGFDVPGSHFDASSIRWSDKNIHEQHCVETYLVERLSQFSSHIEKQGPYTARAGQLVHLRTDLRFRLPDARHLGDVLLALHPTPAVCGLPKEQAWRFILDNESSARRYYSGFCGLLDFQGRTRLFVSLRCMNIGDRSVRLYAGGGLLQESAEQQEWEETEAKMETMRRLLWLPPTTAPCSPPTVGRAT